MKARKIMLIAIGATLAALGWLVLMVLSRLSDSSLFGAPPNLDLPFPTAISTLPDGTVLVGYADGTVAILDGKSQKSKVLPGLNALVSAVRLEAGRLPLVCSSGALQQYGSEWEPMDAAEDVGFDALIAEGWYAYCSFDGLVVRSYDTAKREWRQALKWQSGPIAFERFRTVCFTTTPSEKTLIAVRGMKTNLRGVSMSFDCEMLMQTVSNNFHGAPRQVALPGMPAVSCISADEDALYLGGGQGWNGILQVVQLSTGKTIETLRLPRMPMSISVNPLGGRIVVGLEDRVLEFERGTGTAPLVAREGGSHVTPITHAGIVVKWIDADQYVVVQAERLWTRSWSKMKTMTTEVLFRK